MTTTPEPEIFTCAEAAVYLRMHVNQFRKDVLPTLKVIRNPGRSTKIRIPKASLQDWVAKNAQRH